MRTRIAILASLLLASACSSPTPPEPVKPVEQPKPPVQTPPPAVKPAGHWLDWPLAAGDWVYRQDDRGSLALFGATGQDATVTLRCDRGRQRIYLSIRGNVASPTTLTMRSSSTTKQWAAAPTGGAPNYVAAEIMPRDPGLDAMLYSRGRIALEVPGLASIAIPNWAEMDRVVEDCR